MKKDFLIGLGIAEDVAEKIMAENGKDITREQNKFADYDDTKSALKKAQDTISGFGDVDSIKADVAKYKTEAETARKEAADKIAQLETTAKVKDYLSGKKFVNELTRDAIASKLAETLGSDESKGKSLDDLFTGLTKDQKNILVDENAPKPPVQTAMSAAPQGAQDGVEAAFAKLNPAIKI